MAAGRNGCRHKLHCSPAHASLVADYAAARHAWWSAMEDATALYATEVAEYRRDNPPPTFRDFLVDRAAERAYWESRDVA